MKTRSILNGCSNVLFVHADKSGADITVNIKYISIGMIALADFIQKGGYKAEIINLYTERLINKQFDLTDYCVRNNYKIICLSLQWHQQSYDVLETIKLLKNNIPDVICILGGFTASYFDTEILREFKAVDFIIRGDSERPLLKLCHCFTRKSDNYHLIPNLTWRSDGEIIRNPISHKVTSALLNTLDFCNLKLVHNFSRYLTSSIFYDDPTKKMFVFNCGRGCSVNCSLCGGGALAQSIVNGRNECVFMDVEHAVNQLIKLKSFGLAVWHTSFHPKGSEVYYIDLFRLIRKKKLRFGCMFECWHLPSENFLEEFSATFTEEDSNIIISPESGSERVRKCNKGYFFSNKELYKTLEYAQRKKILVELSLTAGLPHETLKDLRESVSFIKDIKSRYPEVIVKAETIEIEPASPAFRHPEVYGIETERRTFLDFYRTHRADSSVGYRTSFLTKKQIMKYVWYFNFVAKKSNDEMDQFLPKRV